MNGHSDPGAWWGVALFAACWMGGAYTVFGLIFVRDRILRRLHDRHRETWAELGGPRGMFWTPQQTSARRRPYDSRAVRRVFVALRRSENAALAGDAELHAMLARDRRFVWAQLGILAALVALVVGGGLVGRS
jgi:hypothetical protein